MANNRVRTRAFKGSVKAIIASATGRYRTPAETERLKRDLDARASEGEPLKADPALAAALRALGVRV